MSNAPANIFGTDGIRDLWTNDASTDGSAEMVAEAHPGVRLLRRGANAGFARAVNEGVAASAECGRHVPFPVAGDEMDEDTKAEYFRMLQENYRKC